MDKCKVCQQNSIVLGIDIICTHIPEERREFVAQYAVKFIVEHGNCKDLSDEKLRNTFEHCALPLRPVFYPMVREEILKLKEAL